MPLHSIFLHKTKFIVFIMVIVAKEFMKVKLFVPNVYKKRNQQDKNIHQVYRIMGGVLHENRILSSYKINESGIRKNYW